MDDQSTAAYDQGADTDDNTGTVVAAGAIGIVAVAGLWWLGHRGSGSSSSSSSSSSTGTSTGTLPPPSTPAQPALRTPPPNSIITLTSGETVITGAPGGSWFGVPSMAVFNQCGYAEAQNTFQTQGIEYTAQELWNSYPTQGPDVSATFCPSAPKAQCPWTPGTVLTLTNGETVLTGLNGFFYGISSPAAGAACGYTKAYEILTPARQQIFDECYPYTGPPVTVGNCTPS